MSEAENVLQKREHGADTRHLQGPEDVGQQQFGRADHDPHGCERKGIMMENAERLKFEVGREKVTHGNCESPKRLESQWVS